VGAFTKDLSAEKDVGFVLLGRAGSIQGYVAGSGVKLDQVIGDQVMLYFLTADIGQHIPVDLDAWGKWLATFLLHFPTKCRVLDDVLFFIRKFVLGQDCPDSIAPAAMGFQIGDNLRFIHNA
jgi:hypothetical protein